ncbi:MAG TPA: chemotaxis protein CheB [Kofleriaceae bacterium]|nr:chemotaxis protein CheB [Kofleriaceae bacterium]
MNRDIITIGASAGGVEVLLEMAHALPKDLPAAVFVVVHVPVGFVSSLPELIARRSALEARHPLHDEAIEHGTIYVAPPDMHLQVRPGMIEVVRGPKDNGFRPAADVLFRSASNAYGSRVIGVVLSGYRDCGTAGMLSVKARGGLAVVQDPTSAVAPEMPQNVIDSVAVDHVVHPLELPGLLARLVTTEAGPAREPGQLVKQVEGTEKGLPSDIVCPICEGVLTETQPGLFQHFRCHVGHGFSLESLVREQGEEMERVLWAAIRALEESAALSHRISLRETGELRKRFEEKAATQTQQANYIRELVLHGARLDRADASKL